MPFKRSGYICLALICCTYNAHADTLNIAVASNFTHTLRQLAVGFENKTGHNINVISGSTGKLYSQIIHGAPFDIFLAADEKRPDELLSSELVTADFSRNYAQGKLVLISHLKMDSCQNILSSTKLKRLAIANPKTAPYGLAAKQVLENLGLWRVVKPKLVTGENVSQVLHYFSTSNVDAGIIAKSLFLQVNSSAYSCSWEIPDNLYKPINQKMVLLSSTNNKHAARTFWQYMQSIAANDLMKQYGYAPPDNPVKSLPR